MLWKIFSCCTSIACRRWWELYLLLSRTHSKRLSEMCTSVPFSYFFSKVIFNVSLYFKYCLAVLLDHVSCVNSWAFKYAALALTRARFTRKRNQKKNKMIHDKKSNKTTAKKTHVLLKNSVKIRHRLGVRIILDMLYGSYSTWNTLSFPSLVAEVHIPHPLMC